MFTNMQLKNSWPETSTSYNMHTGSQLITSTVYLKNVSPSFFFIFLGQTFLNIRGARFMLTMD